MINHLNLDMQSAFKSLQTIKNYAVDRNVTASYIYKLVKERKMQIVLIDGVKFVDSKQFPAIPVSNRRK
jgi:hypothetical protein